MIPPNFREDHVPACCWTCTHSNSNHPNKVVCRLYSFCKYADNFHCVCDSFEEDSYEEVDRFSQERG